MTPLGCGLLTGVTEIDDPVIRNAMGRMLSAAPAAEVNQTVLDLVALTAALCSVLGEHTNTSKQDVIACALAR